MKRDKKNNLNLIFVILVFILLFVVGIIFILNKEKKRDFVCKEFEENILWTSGYSSSQESSVNYQTWIPAANCTEAGGENCFLRGIKVDGRIIYLNPFDENINGETYVQISDPDELICNDPKKGKYSENLFYKQIKNFESEGIINLTSESELNSKFNSNCYGIKVYSSPYILTDVFKVKYELCGEDSDEKGKGGKNE